MSGKKKRDLEARDRAEHHSSTSASHAHCANSTGEPSHADAGVRDGTMGKVY